MELYGVDQTIISIIQTNQFRGHIIKIYVVHFDPDTGVMVTPDLIFRGRQNGDYEISENREGEHGGTVTVKTRITSDLSAINIRQSCRTNVHSHEEFLRRSGVGSPVDVIFNRVPTIMDKVIFWGQGWHAPITPPGGGGGGFVPDPEDGGEE